MRKDGIRTLECIKGRCRVNDTGCWLWAGAVTAAQVPCASVPVGAIGNDRRLTMPAYKLGWLLQGKPLKPGQMLLRKVTCHNQLCVNPDHRKAGNRSDINRAAAQRGSYQSEARTANLWANRGKQAIPPDDVARLESLMAEGLSAAAAAASVGCDKDTAYKVRDGRHMHQRRAASVFAWRPAC